MSKISLAEAVKLKSVLSKRIHELEEEMDRLALVPLFILFLLESFQYNNTCNNKSNRDNLSFVF